MQQGFMSTCLKWCGGCFLVSLTPHLPSLKFRLATALAIFLIGITALAVATALQLVDKGFGVGSFDPRTV
jgi:hypothetical protein